MSTPLARSMPAHIILCIDIVTLLLAIAILTISVYAWVQLDTFELFVSLTTVGIGIGVGIALILTSCCGICGATRGNRYLLFCYFFLLAGCFTAQVIGCVYIVTYNNIVATQNSYASSTMTTQPQVDLNNAVLSVYTTCCTGCPNGASCNQVNPTTAMLLPYCNSTTAGRTCAFAVPCSTTTNMDGCYVNPPGFSTVNVPTYKVAPGLCTALSQVAYNGSYLVSNAYPEGGCGGGLPEVFLHETNGYMAWVFNWLMIVFIFFACLQGFNALCTLYLEMCWSPVREYDNNCWA
jgi:hypothetical protein